MKLEKIALVAEIVSGVAVVVTLVFLVLSIRDNTNVVRATAYAGIVDSADAFNVRVGSDPELIRLYSAYLGGRANELTGDDEVRLAYLINSNFRNLEKAFFLNQYGILGEAESRRTLRRICGTYQRTKTTMEWWTKDRLPQLVTSEFLEYIESTCP